MLQILLTAFALSMDAVAVSVGICSRKDSLNSRGLLWMALSFGVFQAFMPMIGYGLGKLGSQWLQNVDHWIAFLLLLFVGGKMLWEAWKSDAEDDSDVSSQARTGSLPWKTLLTLSIATSIDAAAIGVTFSLLGSNLIHSIITIGVLTFALSWLGGHFGRRLGSHFGTRAEIVGGILLILIGVRILWEHGIGLAV